MSPSALEASTRQYCWQNQQIDHGWQYQGGAWKTRDPRHLFMIICCHRNRLNNTRPHGWPGRFSSGLFRMNLRSCGANGIRRGGRRFTKSIRSTWCDVMSLVPWTKSKTSNIAENRRAGKQATYQRLGEDQFLWRMAGKCSAFPPWEATSDYRTLTCSVT